jgi:hypothetical protein
VLLKEVLDFLQASMTDFKDQLKQILSHLDDDGKVLIDTLRIQDNVESTISRINDAEKVLNGVSNDINGIREQVHVFNEKRLQSIFQQLKAGTSVQIKTQRATEHSDSKMKVIEIVMSGSLALALVNTFIGQYSFVVSGQTPWAILNYVPLDAFIWLMTNVAIWLAFSLGIFLIMKKMQDRAEKLMLAKFSFEKAIDLDAMERFLSQFDVNSSDVEETDEKMLKTVKFNIQGITNNPFDNHEVGIEMVYDIANGFLYDVNMEISMPRHKEGFFRSAMVKELEKHGVFKR